MVHDTITVLDIEAKNMFRGLAMSSTDCLFACIAVIMDPTIILTHLSFQFQFGTYYYFLLIALTILAALPITGLQIFYGVYFKYSYLKFWDLSPALKGIGYVLIFLLFMEIRLHARRIFLVVQILISCINMNWKDCDFEHNFKHCLPVDMKNSIDNDCCEENNCRELNFSSIVFVETKYLTIGLPNDFTFVMTICFLLVFLVMHIELKKTMRFCKNIIGTVFIFFIIYAAMVLSYSQITSLKPINVVRHKSENWVEGVVAIYQCALFSTRPGLILFLSSRTNGLMESGTFSKLLYMIKLLTIGFLYVSNYTIMHFLLEKLNIKHEECLPRTGRGIYFGAMITVLYTMTDSRVVIVFYFIMIGILDFAYILMKMSSIIHSVVEEFIFRLEQRQRLIAFITVAVGYVVTLVGNLKSSHKFLSRYIPYVAPSLNLNMMFCFVLGIICYRIENIEVDYQYSYGMYSAAKSQHIKIAIAVTILGCLINLYNFFSSDLPTNTFMMLIFLHIPIVISFLVAVAKTGSVANALTPAMSFGPDGLKNHLARNSFHPHKVARYDINDSSILCGHNCLKHSVHLKQEIEFFKKKLSDNRRLYRLFLAENRMSFQQDMERKEEKVQLKNYIF